VTTGFLRNQSAAKFRRERVRSLAIGKAPTDKVSLFVPPVRSIACANAAPRVKLVHRIKTLCQASDRHRNFDDVREIACD
jgi:hypothetical protein